MWRLPLLEGLFSLLFLKSSDIRETLSSERDQNDGDDDVKRKSPQFIVTAALIRGLLGVLEDCLEHDEKDDEKDETLKRQQNVYVNMSRNQEGVWRLCRY